MVFTGICEDMSGAFIFAGTRASSNSNIPHASRLLSTFVGDFCEEFLCVPVSAKHQQNEKTFI